MIEEKYKRIVSSVRKSFMLATLFFLLFCATSNGQSLAGITHKADTSFTTYSAWKKSKKDFPDISIVTPFHFSDVAEKKSLVYCNTSSRKLLIDAFCPKEKKSAKRVAIIFIHGGGWRSGDRSQHYPLAETLAHLGYVCFTPQYRLSTEALFPAAVYDVKAAIRWVRKNAAEFNVDISKIVIAGFSAGGELAAFAGTTGDMPLFEGCDCNGNFSSKANAIVDIDGTLSFTNSESGEGDDSKRTSAATYWFGYPKKGNEVLWEAASPLSYVSCETPPTLFINSSLDRMHAGRNDFIKMLDSCHIYSEVHTFRGSPHAFCLFNPWFEPTVSYIDNFLNKVFLK